MDQGGLPRDAGRGRDQCECGSEDEASVVLIHHEGVTFCFGFNGTIKPSLGKDATASAVNSRPVATKYSGMEDKLLNCAIVIPN
jgi:hypothetical protein